MPTTKLLPIPVFLQGKEANQEKKQSLYDFAHYTDLETHTHIEREKETENNGKHVVHSMMSVIIYAPF